MIARQYQVDLCRKAWSENEDLQSSSHSECSDEEDTRREVLHEMSVPTVLREPWSKAENHVKLRSYFVKFRLQPADRDYRPFDLGPYFLSSLGLWNVRNGPASTTIFSRDEIALAEKFQEMFLKVILNRK
ncbi:hypothetical protein POM88_005784 [Heracleum sosnowskyi]|uniref:Uncharacterized protein n=1 Tax=Heracleum sosnowskyi TaxID=360622 RepID=A0AAD8J458_9APIA|nr:hypothetical protein POM88_005784 [Heracleum sosnowskyi]